MYTDDERQRFISDGYAPTAIMKTSSQEWWAVGKDKLVNYLVMKAHGLPIPVVTAVVHPVRVYPDAVAIRSHEALVEWLRGATYPQFAKPVTGLQSKGQSLLLGYDAEQDELLRKNEPPIAVTEFARSVMEMEGLTANDGYLFQDVLRPDPRVSEWVGDRLTGCRVVVMIEDDGPRITHVVWKIVVGDNYADNYSRTGNLAAHVDPETGEVLRIVRGTGLDLEVVRKHPDTGELLQGRVLPDWDEVRRLVLEGARLMPKIRLQGWDVGLCDGGPVLIEGNLGTGFALMQLSSGQGFMTPEFEDFLTRTEAKVEAEQTRGQMI